MQVVLFDIDGTLISSGGAGKSALEAALASEFGIDRLIEKLSLSGRTDRAILGDVMAMHALDPTPEISARLIESYLRHLPTQLCGSQGCVLPGIQPILESLRGRPQVAVGLLTGNTRRGAEIKLAHFGLWDYFSFGGYGDDHLDRDDVARMALREAVACCGGPVNGDRVWVIGDTPLDIRCARAIGAKAVAVATGWHTPEELAAHKPDLLFHDLGETEAFLKHL